MNDIHTILAIYLLAINVITFFVYGIDKWKASVKPYEQSQASLSFAMARKRALKAKAKRNKWRIPEATLLLLAVIGGSIGAWLGMKAWHHKTMHKKFKYGVPLIFILQMALLIYIHTKL